VCLPVPQRRREGEEQQEHKASCYDLRGSPIPVSLVIRSGSTSCVPARSRSVNPSSFLEFPLLATDFLQVLSPLLPPFSSAELGAGIPLLNELVHYTSMFFY